MMWNATNLVLRLAASLVLYQAYTDHPFWLTLALLIGNIGLTIFWVLTVTRKLWN